MTHTRFDWGKYEHNRKQYCSLMLSISSWNFLVTFTGHATVCLEWLPPCKCACVRYGSLIMHYQPTIWDCIEANLLSNLYDSTLMWMTRLFGTRKKKPNPVGVDFWWIFYRIGKLWLKNVGNLFIHDWYVLLYMTHWELCFTFVKYLAIFSWQIRRQPTSTIAVHSN